MKSVVSLATLVAAFAGAALVEHVAWAQVATPIFMDDFENGAAGTALDTSRWLSVTSGAGTSAEIGNFPNFQASTGTFGSGALYLRLFDNEASATGPGPRAITSNTAGSDNREAQISGMVTTFSFDFLDTIANIATAGQGIGFGYTSADDLNTNERAFKAFFRGGLLAPDSVVDAAPAVAYDLDVKHTLWMIANDSTTAVENYRDGQTLEPAQADVWIKIGAAEPVFAFAVNRQFPAGLAQGVGFRSFTGDSGEILVDNVLLLPGATFDRTAFNAPAGPNANFNGLGTVDQADLELWRGGYSTATGATRAQGDADGDGDVDGQDFTIWQRQLGTTPAAGTLVAAAPEPAAIVLAALCLVAVPRRRR